MPLSVLAVEDSRTQLIRIRADLESHGFDVFTAEDGDEALATARRERPDVILSDILMPGMDGFRLCREVQMDPTLRDIPVVLRTAAFLSEEDRAFAFKVGARGYVDKDIDRGQLGTLLTQIASERENCATDGLVQSEDFHESYQERLLTRLVEEAARLEKVNEQLRESRAQLQVIHDHSPIFIYVKDLEGRYSLTNAHFGAIGLDPEAMVGRTDMDIFDADYAAALMANDRRVLDERRALHIEEIVPTDEGLHTLLSAKAPLMGRDGELTGLCGVSIDITERSRMEERLRQAERMEALGRLAGGVAHDFNNLLTIISNYTLFVVEDLPEGDVRREDLEQVQDAATRATSLIRQLLAFGGRQATDDEAQSDLNQVITEMEGLLKASTSSRIDLIQDLGSDVPPVQMDRTKVDQIVLNLVANARDAMPNGGKITISTRPELLTETMVVGEKELPPGPYALLRAADTGTGMNEETLRNIFEPFFTTKDPDKGTGLGLATIHGIVRSAGGAIAVSSALGQGTTFTIWLPAATERSDEVEKQDVPPRPVEATPTILVVDDDDSIRSIIRRTLERAGYRVVVASEGAEALEVYEGTDRVDLVVTDIRMPGGMSGIELAARLRARDQSLPVAHISGSEIARGPGVLQKPFTPSTLLKFVEDILQPESPPQ